MCDAVLTAGGDMCKKKKKTRGNCTCNCLPVSVASVLPMSITNVYYLRCKMAIACKLQITSFQEIFQNDAIENKKDTVPNIT